MSALRTGRERGLSLVELMVGLAVGMVVVAAAVSLFAAQTREHRRTAAELRLMQELRGATDLVARDLRRAGHWGDAAAGLWAAAASTPSANPYAAFVPVTGAATSAAYSYSRDATENHLRDSNEQFGLRLRSGVVELQLGAGNWQALTDAGSMTVTTFEIRPHLRELPLLAHCPRPCPVGVDCTPRLQQRSLAVHIAAQATGDPSVQRQLDAEVQLRNPVVLGSCPA
ncbi:MAG: prepilin-type N-terminal cleavage/methylation domain-containing protein [Piscinibacter sp.]|nr:prepilin-type N-terminal cleavage/methylation domain-containing protein [Piscinibacter sp.]